MHILSPRRRNLVAPSGATLIFRAADELAFALSREKTLTQVGGVPLWNMSRQIRSLAAGVKEIVLFLWSLNMDGL
jgi:hypothetical protein